VDLILHRILHPSSIHSWGTHDRDVEDDQFSNVLRWYVSYTQHPMCALHLFDVSTQSFFLTATSGLQASFQSVIAELQSDAPGLGQIIGSHTRILVTDTHQDALWAPLRIISDLCRIRSAYIVPISANGILLGAMTTFFAHPMQQPAIDTNAHIEAARVVAPLLEQARKTHPSYVVSQPNTTVVTQPWQIAPLRPEVQNSHKRCQAWFGDLTTHPPSPRLSQDELMQKKQENLTLLNATHQYLDTLFKQRRDLDWAVLVCDASCWILEATGSPLQLKRLAAQGIVAGINFSEQYVGNSAIGTSLLTRQPVHFHGHEHYFSQYREWSTAGAPILLDDGTRCTGAFAFVTQASQVDPFIPALVHATSIAIAHWLELEEYRQDTVRVHQSLLSQLDYHVVYLDANHQVTEERHPIPLGPDAINSMRAITRQGECSDYELTIDGRTYLVDVRKLTDHTGHMKGTLGLFRDISQRKEYEVRLREVEKLSMLTSLTAGIAHEIRNPLTTARGFLQLFYERLASEQDKRFLTLTIAELDRIQSLVKDFMGLAKPQKANYGLVNLTNLLVNVAQFLHPEAAMHNVPFTFVGTAEQYFVWADESQLKQVLMNIVQNALHACVGVKERAAGVRVWMAADDTWVHVCVEDTGVGIKSKELEKVFRPFYTTKETGTGLGLSICKRIMEEHGGMLQLDSTENVGTVVKLSLTKRSV